MDYNIMILRFWTAAIRHSTSLRLRWHCRKAVGNVANVLMLPISVLN